MKKILKSLINSLGWELSNLKAVEQRKNEYVKVVAQKSEIEIALNKLLFIIKNRPSNKSPLEDFIKYAADNLSLSKSQLLQDLFVLYHLKGKQGGFFIEFGATDGISLSNSFLLEKQYNWKGILAEPGRVWGDRLKANRNCIIDTRCVWSKSGEEVVFHETAYAELSTIDLFAQTDYHAEKRKDRKSYTIETVSLNDLLKFHKAPVVIDYLSIDTEGSEFEILNAFNFSGYDIKVITVEHNFSQQRDHIFQLLRSKGYERVFEDISLFDDWYIQKSLKTDILVLS
ncbi:MAG: FkbM family methyltransferase [Ginsengibacter sp.]